MDLPPTDFPFHKLNFIHPWRSYQQRILDHIDEHLKDGHLHVVAAPGSGKTVLGIEVIKRSAQACIVLAPTLTIRNQWQHLLLTQFCPAGFDASGWISTSLHDPKPITLITYQALHAAFTSSKEEKDTEKQAILDQLKTLQTSLLVLDEAHHLRKEWWKALTELKDLLENPTVVSLTATPPYDVGYAEWQRYSALCGDIDEEISIPELVKNGDLCPHQDYVFFSLPTPAENERILDFKKDVTAFVESLNENHVLIDIIQQHPWVTRTNDHVEKLLAEPQFFSALLIFLHATGATFSEETLNVLGAQNASIPPLTAEWLELFLTRVLFYPDPYLEAHKKTLTPIRTHLKQIGAVERKKVIITDAHSIQKTLTHSLSKLNSIKDITESESASLGSQLRQVILTDHIRATDLPKHADDKTPLSRLGVIPIFEFLRRAQISNIKLGVLTGSIIILPKNTRKLVERIANEMQILDSHLAFSVLPHTTEFIQLKIRSEHSQKIVHLITEVFNQGGITVLVGTQALLGEGWDAPSINTLILASNIGSYMLSNQMRGRAIRINPEAKNKVSNIWHLATVDSAPFEASFSELLAPSTVMTAGNAIQTSKGWSDWAYSILNPPPPEVGTTLNDLGEDLQILKRRFRCFQGLSHTQPIIENGINRFSFKPAAWDYYGIQNFNTTTLSQAAKRDALPSNWQNALIGDFDKPQTRRMIRSNHVPAGFHYLTTLKYLALSTLYPAIAFGLEFILNGWRFTNDFSLIVWIGLAIMALHPLPRLGKALFLWMRNGTMENSLKQISKAILYAMFDANLLATHPDKLSIHTRKHSSGLVYCEITGTTKEDQKHFMDAIEDVLSPVKNARYLIIRHSKIGPVKRVDYHQVPAILASKKENAEHFLKRWQQFAGDAELVFTRRQEGRQILLKARIKSYASGFQRHTDRVSVWK